MKPKRPVLRYHGGKWKLAPQIISNFPVHKVYVEPFAVANAELAKMNADLIDQQFVGKIYKCPKCLTEWRTLKGDTDESIVRCMNCCERFPIGPNLVGAR